jgi:hypothetical protein
MPFAPVYQISKRWLVLSVANLGELFANAAKPGGELKLWDVPTGREVSTLQRGIGGTASVSNSMLNNNQASGGHNDRASGPGAGFAGLGAGGAIFNALGNYDSSGYGPFDASVVTVTDSQIDQNQSQGGGGGNGAGGGIANLLSATTMVTGSIQFVSNDGGVRRGVSFFFRES